MKNLKLKKVPEIQETMDMLYDTVDELQEMVNALLDENERLRSMAIKEREEEEKMCDTLYMQWFKEQYGITPEEADELDPYGEEDYI